MVEPWVPKPWTVWDSYVDAYESPFRLRRAIPELMFHCFWAQVAIAAVLSLFWAYVRVGMGNDDFRDPGTWMYHFESEGLWNLPANAWSEEII